VTEVLAIVAFGALFVVFGLFHKGRTHETAGCESCSTKGDTAACGDCPSVSEISEQSHG